LKKYLAKHLIERSKYMAYVSDFY